MSRANEPAYPVPYDTAENSGTAWHGMSVRERFAMAALQGLLASGYESHINTICERAALAADRLIAELAKPHVSEAERRMPIAIKALQDIEQLLEPCIGSTFEEAHRIALVALGRVKP